jgi:hypothetical protein
MGGTMNNLFSPGPASLDPEQFKENPSTYALALVVRDETEAQRVTEGGRLLPDKRGVSLGLLGNADLWAPANFKRWYEFITNMDVLKRCAVRLGLPLAIVTERVYKELSPPNWETLFWMYAFLETLGDSVRAQTVLESRIKEAGERAISTMAKKGSDERHGPNRESKQKVFAWCDENMGRFKSMDDAAWDIAETFVPQKFRAVREWMTEWKKLRSTGKP